jgi:hypothetical protein
MISDCKEETEMKKAITLTTTDFISAFAKATVNAMEEGVKRGLSTDSVMMMTLIGQLLNHEMMKVLFSDEDDLEEKLEKAIGDAE